MPDKIRIRKHCGSLSDSMETCKQIHATKEAIKQYFRETFNQLGFNEESLETVQVEYYTGKDTRIGWEQTYIVLVDNHPYAFTDGPIQQQEK